MQEKTSFTAFIPISVIIPGFSTTSAKPYFTKSPFVILPMKKIVANTEENFRNLAFIVRFSNSLLLSNFAKWIRLPLQFNKAETFSISVRVSGGKGKHIWMYEISSLSMGPLIFFQISLRK